MSASVLLPSAFLWEHTVTSDLPYAALLTDEDVVRNLRVCVGEDGRNIVAAWADAQQDQGSTLALLSEDEYRCLREQDN
jgi:hypothetical protein